MTARFAAASRRPLFRRLPAAALLVLAIAGIGAAASASSGGAPLLIRGGTVVTVTRGVLAPGDVLVRGGKIAAVAARIDPPPGAEILEANGRWVLPGIVDMHSHMGVYPWPGVEANSDGNEMTDPITPWMRAADAIWAEDPEFALARAGGVTTAQVIPGSGNLIGGEGVTLKLRPAADVADMVFKGAPSGVKMALGENPKRVYGGRDKMPATRMGNMALFRDAFTRARNYQAKWAAWRARDDADRGAPPDTDLKLEALVNVLEGRARVHVHSYRKDEILTFLDIADAFGFKVTSLQHGLEAYKIADDLARRDIAVATFAHWWGYKVEAIDGLPHNAALLARRGVKASIHSDSGSLIQRLYTEAAVAARYGLSEEDALAAITLNAAAGLGVADRIGSIEPGKDADFAIFTRHPLDVYTLVETTILDGRIVHQRPSIPTPAALPPMPAPRRGPSAPPPADLAPAAAPENPRGLYAVVGGRVFTMAGAPIDDGTVIVENGRIREIGPRLPAPAGATVIDARGALVFPGFIEGHSHLGLAEIDAVDVMRDEDEATDPVLPQLRVLDAYYTESEMIPVARLHGLTAALAAPGEGNVIGGIASVVRLAGDSPRAVAIKEDAALVINLGEAPKARYGARNQMPSTRMGTAALVRDAFTKARDYRARWAGYRLKAAEAGTGAAPARGAAAKPHRGKETGAPEPPDRDLKMEALVPALDGTMPVFVRAHRADDILTALRLADEFGLRLILSHGTEAWKVAATLAARNIPVVVGPISTQPEAIETLGATYENAARLHRAGVRIAIQVGEVTNARMLPYEAGLAVAHGLPWEEAIRALTINTAEILGVADRIGSLRPGRDADLIVTEGDPLQPLARLRHLMIAGRPVPLVSRQTRLYEAWWPGGAPSAAVQAP
jgi:imidazolonepropionase-like amidohydrolase